MLYFGYLTTYAFYTTNKIIYLLCPGGGSHSSIVMEMNAFIHGKHTCRAKGRGKTDPQEPPSLKGGFSLKSQGRSLSRTVRSEAGEPGENKSWGLKQRVFR